MPLFGLKFGSSRDVVDDGKSTQSTDLLLPATTGVVDYAPPPTNRKKDNTPSLVENSSSLSSAATQEGEDKSACQTKSKEEPLLVEDDEGEDEVVFVPNPSATDSNGNKPQSFPQDNKDPFANLDPFASDTTAAASSALPPSVVAAFHRNNNNQNVISRDAKPQPQKFVLPVPVLPPVQPPAQPTQPPPAQPSQTAARSVTPSPDNPFAASPPAAAQPEVTPQNPFTTQPPPTKQPPPTQEPSPQPPQLQEQVSGFLNRSDYEDPVTYQIMADPVTCQDGHTYDRAVIERCFDDRIKAEEERQRKEREREREEAGNTADEEDDTVCCGRREPIELLSPISNKVVSGVLVPNFILEQQIVRLMEANAFGLDQDEVEDWQERRRQKKVRDKERLEQEAEAKRLQEERERNAREAQERRNQEGDQDEPAEAAAVDPSHQVRRSTNGTNSEAATGLAVALAQNGTQIPAEFITGSGCMLRCMVDRCSKRLGADHTDHQWCARCARLVCSDCLAFGVHDFNQAAAVATESLQTICVDCIAQLVDVLETSNDVYLRQRRVLLLRQMEMHTARFANRAATLQEFLVRREANRQHAPQLINIEHNQIGRLQQRLAELKHQAAEAQARAAAAQADQTAPIAAPSTSSQAEMDANIARLRSEHEKMEEELAQLTQNPPSEDDSEASMIQYFEAVSDLSHRIEISGTELAIQMSASAEAAASAAAQAPPRPGNPEAQALQTECEQLATRYTEVEAAASAATDADEAMQHMLELSALSAQLEDAQIRLVTAQSMANSGASAPPQPQARPGPAPTPAAPKPSSLPSTSAFIAAAQDSSPTGRRKKSFFRLSRRSARNDEATQEWLQSLSRIRNELTVGSSPEVAIRKSRELMSLLIETRHHFGGLEPANLGLEAARTELKQLIASSQQQIEQSETVNSRSTRSEDSDIFSDAVADLIGEDGKPVQTFDVLASLAFECGEDGHGQEINADEAAEDLQAIGSPVAVMEQWPLPLGLEYPTQRMTRQLEVLRNTLQLRKVESERVVEGEWMDRFQNLEARRDELEDEVAKASRNLASAEASAQDEERRQRERAEERARRERERLERERQLREKAEQAERERQELLRRHRNEEAATQAAFSNAAGQANAGAERFGGSGDLRMCKRCKSGPIENQACSDLSSHNDSSNSYKGNTVFSKRNPNHCPHCGWFDADWKKWPYWDGVYGPH